MRQALAWQAPTSSHGHGHALTQGALALLGLVIHHAAPCHGAQLCVGAAAVLDGEVDGAVKKVIVNLLKHGEGPLTPGDLDLVQQGHVGVDPAPAVAVLVGAGPVAAVVLGPAGEGAAEAGG